MYTLFWSEGTASFAPHAVLVEAGLAHDLVLVDISAGEHQTQEFLTVNPAGQVPVLGTPDGEYLTEAAAICLYLADKHQLKNLAPGINDPDRGIYLSSLLYLATTVQDTYKRFYYPERYSTDKDDALGVKEQSVHQLKELWKSVDVKLSSCGPFHLGDRYSLVDIYALMLATWYDPQKELLYSFPSLKRCCDMVMERPAVQSCIALQSKIGVGR